MSRKLYVIFLFFLLTMLVQLNPQAITPNTYLEKGSFTVYKSTDHIYYPYKYNLTNIYINVVEQVFQNGSILLNSTDIDCSSNQHIGLRIFTVGNASSCIGMRYISPTLLGQNISGLTFEGIKDGYYIYASSNSIQGVNVLGIYYFMPNGVAYKIIFNQTSSGILISSNCITLVSTNIDNLSASIPYFSYQLKTPTNINFINSIVPPQERIDEYIVGAGIIAIIVILIFRKNN